MDELDKLLGAMGADTGSGMWPQTPGGSQPTRSSGMDELDLLMAALDRPSQPSAIKRPSGMGAPQQPSPAAQRPGSQMVGQAPMGRPGSVMTGQAPVQSRPAQPAPRTDSLDEIDSLIGMLESPSMSQPNSRPGTQINSRPGSQMVGQAGRGAPSPATAMGDDLDYIIATLGDSSIAPPKQPSTISRPVSLAQPMSNPSAGRGAPPAGRGAPPAGRGAPPAGRGGVQEDADLEMLLASMGGGAGPSTQPMMPQQRPPSQFGPAPSAGRGAAPSGPSSSAPPAGGGASKGACGRCQKPIYGQSIGALGKQYHVECFVCGTCGSSLGTASFFQSQDGSPSCSTCYSALFCARCAHCDQPISGNCMNALGKRYHVNCFMCVQCLRPFGTSTFYERDNNPFCESCFYGIFTSRCAGCDQPIKDDCINACGRQWHPEHFACAHCKKSFGSEPYFEHGGLPYCKLHYHQQQGSLCGCGCGRPVMGRVVQALSKQWLPEHFVCGFCMNQLAGQTFTERDGKAYCSMCYSKLYS